MSETVERKPNNNKRLLGAILLALGALLLVGQIVGAIAGAVAYRAVQRRSEQPVVMAEEIAAQAERGAEMAARQAERAATLAERNAEMAERSAERMSAQFERGFNGPVYTGRWTPFFFNPFNPFNPFRFHRGPGLVPLALILLGVYLVIKQRRAAAAPVPQTGPEADHGPVV
jgi:hypothetical protein